MHGILMRKQLPLAFLGTIAVVVMSVNCSSSSATSEELDHLSGSTEYSLAEDTTEEIITTTRNVDDSENEIPCSSARGSGSCSGFQNCYKIFSEQLDESFDFESMSRANFEHNGLLEDILDNSVSANCSEVQVCCQYDTSMQDEAENFSPEHHGKIVTNNDNSRINSSSYATLPQNCGTTKNFRPIRPQFQGTRPIFQIRWHRQIFEAATKEKRLKITGGSLTDPGTFPWMVAIFSKKGKVSCGGSLISSTYVLTAAHCMSIYTSADIKKLKLHIGDHNVMSLRDGPHEVRRISKVFIHKGFDIKTYRHDIALIKLDHPVTFTSKIQPICLPPMDFNNTSLEGKTIAVAGWGRDRKWGYESAILRSVKMPVWNFDKCKNVYRYFAPNRLQVGRNLCAGDGRRNKDACIGDSGGPLMHQVNRQWVQAGIVSWGKGCGSFPGVYTAVSAYMDWIQKRIVKDSVMN